MMLKVGSGNGPSPTGLLLILLLAVPPGASAENMDEGQAPPLSGVQGTTQKKPKLARRIFSGLDHQIQNAVSFVAGDASLPPSVDDNASWPFLPDRGQKSLYRIIWDDGTTSSIVPRPDGGYSIIGGDAGGTNFMPLSGGGFAIAGRGGDFGTMMPSPGGGFRIMSADGTLTSVVPRSGGGYYLTNAHGELGTIVPGPGGSRYGFGSERSFFSFSIP